MTCVIIWGPKILFFRLNNDVSSLTLNITFGVWHGLDRASKCGHKEPVKRKL